MFDVRAVFVDFMCSACVVVEKLNWISCNI